MSDIAYEDWALVNLPNGTVIKALLTTEADSRRRTSVQRVKSLPGVTVIATLCPEAEPTAHELASRALFANLTAADPERWHIVVTLGLGAAADFADATEGVPRQNSYGQAWRLNDGTWGQRPRTKTAVLLRWTGPKGGR